MSGITWEMLTDVEREDLQFLVENGGGVVYKPRQIRLAELGLITGDDLFSIPTDAGRALVASVDAGDAVAANPFAVFLNEIVTWRHKGASDDTAVYTLNNSPLTIADFKRAADMESELTTLRQQLADARAALAEIAKPWDNTLIKHYQTWGGDLYETVQMYQHIAAKALQAGESGEAE